MRVYQFITPSQIGGAEVHVLTLSRKLIERGHRVTVVCPRGRALTQELRQRGFDVWAPRTTGKLDPVTLQRLAGRLRRDRADVLHTHLSTASLIGSFAARLAGVPAVATVHGLNSRTCFMHARRIIAVSHAVRRHLAAQSVPGERISVIYNGIELARYRDAPDPRLQRAVLGVVDGEMLIGAVGRLGPEKGHSYLIEAAAILVQRESLPVRMVIVGGGKSRHALEQVARRCGVADRVIFAGFQRDVMPYESALDVFCLPSLKEGLSLSALEAMALSKPVVASRVGGTPEVVADGETGLLVEPANPAALAQALSELIRDPQRARAMGQAGRARVERLFDLETVVGQIEDVYRELAGG
ncbi:MAG: glycosyltransferase family 4 protein [Armatimonadota bacterium]|nr:MAG: glycosyltransferase family 4 protein [Armatimonadota bacterium]